MSDVEQVLTVDADFPGGNIVVERMEGDEVFLHQDLRDTTRDWFYWCFRVRGAQGRSLTFTFTQSNVIGVRGPAVSLDQGLTWRWLGASCVQGKSFTYSFDSAGAEASEEVRFSFGMPYLQEHLEQFLSSHSSNQFLKVESLCVSRKGRNVERLHLGCAHREPAARVLLTCRHHCCEMMANYSLQGLMESLLSERKEFAWLRENVEFMIVPFMDKDGVEDGDQGKQRHPHDHNRDYTGDKPGDSIYPEVRAIRDLLPEWSAGLLRIALDLHCPYIRGTHNEVIYLVGSRSEHHAQQQVRFAETLESVAQGELPFRADDLLPYGKAWNTASNYGSGRSFANWAQDFPEMKLASTIEIPYANAHGVEVNQETATAFGVDLARAIQAYLQAF